MVTLSYRERRLQLKTYFDRTAVDAWARLTSDAPLNGIRATVRAGREQMRKTMLDWLPQDLHGRRILDAGCGTGALAVEAAKRGAHVVAIDLSPTLIELARNRLPHELGSGRIEFRVGDMMDPSLGSFDHTVAMDSLIHYRAHDILRVLETFTANTRHSVLFTFAPRTPALTVMHTVGRFFPRGNRAPGIEPVSETTMRQLIATDPSLQSWQPLRTKRVDSGFYISQALELNQP